MLAPDQTWSESDKGNTWESIKGFSKAARNSTLRLVGLIWYDDMTWLDTVYCIRVMFIWYTVYGIRYRRYTVYIGIWNDICIWCSKRRRWDFTIWIHVWSDNLSILQMFSFDFSSREACSLHCQYTATIKKSYFRDCGDCGMVEVFRQCKETTCGQSMELCGRSTFSRLSTECFFVAGSEAPAKMQLGWVRWLLQTVKLL